MLLQGKKLSEVKDLYLIEVIYEINSTNVVIQHFNLWRSLLGALVNINLCRAGRRLLLIQSTSGEWVLSC